MVNDDIKRNSRSSKEMRRWGGREGGRKKGRVGEKVWREDGWRRRAGSSDKCEERI